MTATLAIPAATAGGPCTRFGDSFQPRRWKAVDGLPAWPLGRLRTLARAGPVLVMRHYDTSIPDDDEGLARRTDVGTRAHHVIATLAARGPHPTYAEQTEAVKAAL